MKNVIPSLTKSVLIPLRLATPASTADIGIETKFLGSGTTTLMISNDKMEYIMKIVKSIKDSGVLLKRISETIQNEEKEQKGKFISILLGT